MDAKDYKLLIIKLIEGTNDIEKLSIIYRIVKRYLD